MRNLALLFALLVISAPSVRAVEVQQVRDELEGWVAGRLAEYEIPGAVVAVVQADWPEPMLAGYGLADIENGVEMDPERSVLRVGSISKAVSATLALIAEQEGKLDLHADLRDLFADIPVHPPFRDPMTAHHLLTFTAAFDEELFGQHFRTPGALPELAAFLRDNPPPRFERVGVVSSYNDFQTSLLGHALEQSAGQPFAELADLWLFQPLGMGSSTFRQAQLSTHLASRLAKAYRLTAAGFHSYPRDYIVTTPAAGLYTTAADMARYMGALIRPDSDAAAVLSAGGWARHLSRQFAHLPELHAWGYGFAQDRRKGFEVWFKDGQASGFHARIIVVPELQLGVFSAINRNIIGPAGNFHRAARFSRELGDHLLETLFGDQATGLQVPPPEQRAFDPGLYLGTYRTTVQSRHTPERIITMFDDITVAPGEHAVTIWGGPWREVRAGLLQWHEGGQNYVGFGEPREDGYRYLFVGRGSYERVPWYGASHHTRWLAGVFAGFPLLGLVGGLVWGLRSRRAAGWLLAAHGAVMVAFFASLVLFFMWTDLQQVFFGIPASLDLILTLPLVAAAFLAVLVWGLATRRQGAWTTVLVGAYVVVSVTGLMWLHYWRLVGPG